MKEDNTIKKKNLLFENKDDDHLAPWLDSLTLLCSTSHSPNLLWFCYLRRHQFMFLLFLLLGDLHNDTHLTSIKTGRFASLALFFRLDD